MDEILKLSDEVLEVLNEKEMLFVHGGVTEGTANNGTGTCSAINLGSACNTVNTGNSTCQAVNTGDGNCSTTNNSNSTCNSLINGPAD